MDAERARRFAFAARPGATPLSIARAEGAWLYTEDGRAILDAAGGAIVANVGHGRREVAEAYAREVERVSYAVPPFATESRVRLVERLVSRWLPAGLTRAAFTSGGSEAVDTAIRIARQHHLAAGRPGRWKVIGRELSYHGTTLATLSVGGHTPRRAGFEPWLTPLPKAVACYCWRCPLGKTYPSCRTACVDEVERAIVAAGPDTVAAVIAEPIGGATAGALVPPDDYWPRLAELCRKHGVLLIADEVMTGFGRTGKKFAVDHWGVTPDILVSGKGLTGGYAPMAGIFASEAVVAPIAAREQLLMFFTYSAHPAACAAADRVLQILEREALVARAAAMGEKLGKRLSRLLSHANVGDVRGRGLLWAIELVADKATREPFPARVGFTNRVVAAGLEHGLFAYGGGVDPARDVITFGPPFTISEHEIELIGERIELALEGALSRLH
ncbi:MAG TPA: aspartate aminotransferase family protein [Myxococcota bacterium]|nr:aspartate aminotransferase family protein [Myxococcota bacterium]